MRASVGPYCASTAKSMIRVIGSTRNRLSNRSGTAWAACVLRDSLGLEDVRPRRENEYLHRVSADGMTDADEPTSFIRASGRILELFRRGSTDVWQAMSHEGKNIPRLLGISTPRLLSLLKRTPEGNSHNPPTTRRARSSRRSSGMIPPDSRNPTPRSRPLGRR